MPPGLEDGLQDGPAAGRVPRDRGDRGDGRQPGLIHRLGLRLAAVPRNAGAAARRVRPPAITLSDACGQGERARSRRSGAMGQLRLRRSRPYGTGRSVHGSFNGFSVPSWPKGRRWQPVLRAGRPARTARPRGSRASRRAAYLRHCASSARLRSVGAPGPGAVAAGRGLLARADRPAV